MKIVVRFYILYTNVFVCYYHYYCVSTCRCLATFYIYTASHHNIHNVWSYKQCNAISTVFDFRIKRNIHKTQEKPNAALGMMVCNILYYLEHFFVICISYFDVCFSNKYMFYASGVINLTI
jgi:hypothetical protein